MSDEVKIKERPMHNEEIDPKAKNGMIFFLLNIALMIAALGGFILGVNQEDTVLGVVLIIVGISYFFLIGPVFFAGLKVLKPNEALVLTLFGKYYGTLRGEGFFFVNPFVTAVRPGTASLSNLASSNVADEQQGNYGKK